MDHLSQESRLGVDLGNLSTVFGTSGDFVPPLREFLFEFVGIVDLGSSHQDLESGHVLKKFSPARDGLKIVGNLLPGGFHLLNGLQVGPDSLPIERLILQDRDELVANRPPLLVVLFPRRKPFHPAASRVDLLFNDPEKLSDFFRYLLTLLLHQLH